MAISCTPADLAAAAKCFQCLPSEQKQWIDTYLLAVIAKGSTDPNTLALAAKCFQCIPPGMLRRIQAYLLCQIASGGGGGPCPQDMQVAWTPTNLKLGEELGFFTFGNLPGITSVTFNQTTSVAGFDIESTTQITSLSFPNLVSIDPLDSQNGGLYAVSNSSLTSISTPLLQSAWIIGIRGNATLASLSFPSLTTTPGQFDVENNPLLTTISFPNWKPVNLANVVATGCALTAASVNHILARCVSNAGFVLGSVDLSGGTNAAPSGQGVADKATLIGRGVTVTTN